MDEQELKLFEELFATAGWRRMVRDAEEAIRQREAAALQATSLEELYYYKGEVAQLSILINLEASIGLAAAQFLEDDE